MGTTQGLSKEYVDEQIAFMELGLLAQGTIEAGPEQQERLDELTERLGRGELHAEIDWDSGLRMLISRCVDGRVPEGGANPLAPNSAGGTESLFVADDLTTKRFVAEDGTTLSGYKNVVDALDAQGFAVGGHTDSHAGGEKSGCGANDKLAPIYAFMAEHGDALRALTEKLGIAVPDETHELIVGNAAARTEFSDGSALLAVLKEKAPEELFDELHGDHKEVVAAINMRAGTTLDRDKLAEEFGPQYQAFNVDAWAFEEAAAVISLDEAEARRKTVALAYYNLATAMVLAGPKMRVVTVS